MKEQTTKYAATRFERISYDMFFTGQNIIFMVLSTFIGVYYMGTLGIPATVVAAILLFARIWDAFMDPLLATIIEKSKLKSGKFRPWVMMAAISVPLLTVLCFSFTNFLIDQSLTVRIIYASITYFIWGTLYAAADAPAYALSTAMTPIPEERNLLLTYNKLTGLLGVIIGMAVFPTILNATNNNYFISVLIMSVIAFLTMILIRFTKERVKQEGSSHPTVGEIFKSVIGNKYLVVIVLVGLIANGANFAMTLTPLVASDIYGDPTKVSLMLGIGIIPMLLVAPLSPLLIRKFGKKNLAMFSFAATAIFSLLIFFLARDNFSLFLVLSLVRGLLSAPFIIVSALFFTDCIEYDDYTNGKRFEAVTFAAQTFMSKLVGAISGGVGMWIIGIAGYKAAVAGETVTQTPAALNALWAAMNLGAAVGSIIAIIIMIKFYHLTEDKVKMMIQSNLQRVKA
ncbi:putative symporter YjmB [Paenibacillus allorhizoplanae]|uniref:Symporter YjmB n=1 Tax=Paenibacillus allorhizoplanae TaxID=2905648 RepID=A0ABM9C2Z1_9BACL|nr:glycoside-pentoside-hexuronide (GPH):cation symporter [Paenibacillus allorhizoplanae]CAH1202320.1 putative symporter YjmB [Paenibacillus allorhizoplanae]